jgi:hypothetical protein
MSEVATAAVLLMGVYGIRTHRDPFYMASRAFLWVSIAVTGIPGALSKAWQHWHHRMSVRWKVER